MRKLNTNYGPVLRNKPPHHKPRFAVRKRPGIAPYYGTVLRHQPSYRRPLGKYLKAWWGVPLAAVCLLLLAAVQPFPQFVEHFYARGLYRLIFRVYGFITSRLPISLFEVLAIVGLLAFLGVLFRGIYRWRRNKDCKPLLAILRWSVNGAGALLSMFIIVCAPNYARLTFSELSGLEVRDSSHEELYILCAHLAAEANALREQLSQDGEGVFTLDRSAFSLLKDAQDVFNLLDQRYGDILPAAHIRPKPVLLSHAMSITQITGFFCPITMEANVNILSPPHTLAATACHELAHSRGFMREDEANFIAYLACVSSDDAVFRYSGTMLALLHANNRLFAADPALHEQINDQMSLGVHRDFDQNNRYWSSFEGPVASVSVAVNDAYLKANRQTDGVQSYGRMVDLLLAEHRTKIVQESAS